MCLLHYYRERTGVPLDTPVKESPHSSLLRDDQGNKKCSDCKVWKPTQQFGVRTRHLDGLTYRCKECQSQARYLKKYNLDMQTMQLMLTAQGGCAICHTLDPGLNKWQADHDHSCCPVGPSGGKTCGKCLRGILCSPCNRMLGIVKEDKQTLLSAIQYLEKEKNDSYGLL